MGNKTGLTNDRAEVLNYLMSANSMIKLTTGAVIGGIVRHDVIVIHEACPRVVRDIVENFEMVSLAADGLHILVDAPIVH